MLIKNNQNVKNYPGTYPTHMQPVAPTTGALSTGLSKTNEHVKGYAEIAPDTIRGTHVQGNAGVQILFVEGIHREAPDARYYSGKACTGKRLRPDTIRRKHAQVIILNNSK